MAANEYDFGRDELRDFTTDVYMALLVDSGYTFDATDHFVTDVTPGSNELSGAGYGRETLTGKSRTVDTGAHLTKYDCDNPNFGAIAIGETADAVIVYKFVTDDTDSILIAHYPIGGIATDGLPFVVAVHPNGLYTLD